MNENIIDCFIDCFIDFVDNKIYFEVIDSNGQKIVGLNFNQIQIYVDAIYVKINNFEYNHLYKKYTITPNIDLKKSNFAVISLFDKIDKMPFIKINNKHYRGASNSIIIKPF